jgi:hypothetical protein
LDWLVTSFLHVFRGIGIWSSDGSIWPEGMRIGKKKETNCISCLGGFSIMADEYF